MPDFNSNNNLETFSLPKEKENIVAAIALRIRQSLDLEFILNQTVTEVREFLQTDRVLIYRFEPDWSGVIVVESLNQEAETVFGFRIEDPCFAEEHIERYRQGRISILEDIGMANLTSCYADMLRAFEVKANLVTPIVAREELWGLLIAHHCQSPRIWKASEVELLKQLATQVGIAVQQAELYEQVKSLNIYLEQKVKQRTAKLQNSIQFETLIRKVTEKLRGQPR